MTAEQVVQELALYEKRYKELGPCGCFMYGCEELWELDCKFGCESHKVWCRIHALRLKLKDLI